MKRMLRPAVDVAELPALLRGARVDGVAVLLRGPGSPRLHADGAGVSLDGHNAIADIDGALTLSAAARRLARLGAVFPLARPLPPMTIAAACAALPLFVDAFVQQATLLNGDGDAADTPRAPRAAAGPSLLGALCSRPPLAVAVRVRVRVMLASHAVVRHEVLSSTRAVAARVRELLEESRAFTVEALGTRLVVLAGASLLSSAEGAAPAHGGSFAHTVQAPGRRASFARALSLVPGDVDAMAAALDAGHRVVAAPFMGRCGALVRGSEPLSLVDVARGVAALTSSWIYTGEST